MTITINCYVILIVITSNFVNKQFSRNTNLQYSTAVTTETRMWASAQPDGRPAEHGALCSTTQCLADAHY